jgi:hypothetical protein
MSLFIPTGHSPEAAAAAEMQEEEDLSAEPKPQDDTAAAPMHQVIVTCACIHGGSSESTCKNMTCHTVLQLCYVTITVELVGLRLYLCPA